MAYTDVTSEPVPPPSVIFLMQSGQTSLPLINGSRATSGTNASLNASFPPPSPFLLENQEPFTLPIIGFISPLLVLITIITNTLVCIVLFKRHMRTPTNSLLIAMALSDMFTGVWPMPCYIFFYAFGRYREWLPFDWCFIYFCLTEHLPTIFHTASIWLTMALALQRYIYVCHSLKAKRWCTIPNVIKVIAFIYALAIMAHICRFFEVEFVRVTWPSRVEEGKNVSACMMPFVPFVEMNANIYFNIYFWFRVIFIHFVPCTSLVVFNILLIHAMRAAQARRKQLLMQNRKSECCKLKETNCTTMMMIAVVGVFLLVELPSGIFFIMYIVENTLNITIMHQHTQQIVFMFINLFILLSYPINFFIYCGMSRQFRDTFKRLFWSGGTPLDRKHSHYMSLATENGAKTVATHETAMVNYTQEKMLSQQVRGVEENDNELKKEKEAEVVEEKPEEAS